MMETLSRLVPHTRDVYLGLFDQYGDAIWPLQILAYTLCLLALWSAMRPFPGSGRIVSTVLALAWLWTGIAFQMMTYARLNWIAWPMGFLFVLQGLSFFVSGTLRNRLDFRFDTAGVGTFCGLTFAAAALIVFPLVASPLGFKLPGIGLVGIAPSPTTLFTIALLLGAQPRPALPHFLVPLAWSALASITGLELAVPQDIWLSAAVLLAVVLGLARCFKRGVAANGQA